MPHIIVEFTRNVPHNSHRLLRELTQALHACGPSFPIAAIRARAIELQSYYMADGERDYGFVHIELRIAPGRDSNLKTSARAALLETAKTHFADVLDEQPLAITVELTEAAEKSVKHSNFLVNGVSP